MVEFCPQCSNLLREENFGSKYYLICKCGFKTETDACNEDEKKKYNRKKEKSSKGEFNCYFE